MSTLGVVVLFGTLTLNAGLVGFGTVAATLVTVPPLDGDVLSIVKLGYVPLTLIPVPAVSVTVWSGAVLVTMLPVKSIPVPAVRASCLPSKVLKSVALK